jgi:hypothetical protein
MTISALALYTCQPWYMLIPWVMSPKMAIQAATWWREVICSCEFCLCVLSWSYSHSFLLSRGRNAQLSYASVNIKQGYRYMQNCR